jgi:hypothetical protein
VLEYRATPAPKNLGSRTMSALRTWACEPGSDLRTEDHAMGGGSLTLIAGAYPYSVTSTFLRQAQSHDLVPI